MPATTRSANNQSRIEDFVGKPGSKTAIKRPSVGSQKKPSSKRKTPSDTQPPEENAYKKLKPDVKDTKYEDPIIINRAPVLQLWGAAVAQFEHPDLSWSACLSVGSSISTLCAISKGRSIGVMEPKDEADDTEHKQKKPTDGVVELAVMGFPMQVKGDAVIASGKPKPANENTIKGKFGGDEKYAEAKQAFQEALKSWKGSEDELEKKAFHMYERFRPNVSGGQQGWGRKGKLDLDDVRKIVHK